MMYYHIIEEATDAIIENCSDLNEIINDAKSLKGKYFVVDENFNILYDTNPSTTFKF